MANPIEMNAFLSPVYKGRSIRWTVSRCSWCGWLCRLLLHTLQKNANRRDIFFSCATLTRWRGGQGGRKKERKIANGKERTRGAGRENKGVAVARRRERPKEGRSDVGRP